MERKNLPLGCLTALVTPFNPDGTIDGDGFERNIEFQISQGVKGVVPVGTTGESPTLTSKDHTRVFTRIVKTVEGRVFVLAGCGSNSTKEALHYTEAASDLGCDGVLLVDCYYNGPSSLELREEYYSPIAERFPELTIVPYPIPGRTGCLISATDLLVLSHRYPNIKAVKEATGDWGKIRERMWMLREYTSSDFLIFSGDDDKTYGMMTDPKIKANGAISVISNIAPAAVQKMCQKALAGDTADAEKIREALNPLFGLVTVNQPRVALISEVNDKFRNPLPIKTMMQGLGMPAGPCRQPLGKMTPLAVKQVRDTLIKVWNENSWVLEPIQDFYGVDVPARLADDKIWRDLSFEGGN